MTKAMTWVTALTLMIATIFAGMTLSLTPTAGAQTLTGLDELNAGDLIRGESFNAVYYYGRDGFRYVFPNSKTYFTWYDNFDTVKWIADSDLTKVQIGGNVTYKPGVRMIKINSDKKVYVVAEGGTIRAIGSEAVAKELYGTNWNKMVDDVPDGFFPNYTIGSKLDVASMFNPAGEELAAANINLDKGLKVPTIVYVDEDGFDPATTTIDAGTVVKFIGRGSQKHGASGDDKKWGTGTLNNGDNFSRYFKNVGSHPYHDKYDSSVVGTIIAE